MSVQYAKAHKRIIKNAFTNLDSQKLCLQTHPTNGWFLSILHLHHLLHPLTSSFMASILQLFLFLSCVLHLLLSSNGANSKPAPQSYVVYMGKSSNSNGEDAQVADSSHLQLLSSIIPSDEKERISLIHSYNHAFKGFSAMLTQNEASLLSGHEEIISIFPDPVLQLHTTRSWDFLNAESGFTSTPHFHHPSTDVIIGVIDTGIWPESPSFNDNGIGEIPSRWKGVCMEGSDFKKSNCNRKLIGARYYNIPRALIQPKSSSNKTHPIKFTGSPRDSVGHGTHTASIAAGAPIANASYYGLAAGTARGGSPSTRIASYKACSLEGCSGSTILKAFDDAIKDGVDIISVSIGMSSIFQSDFLDDPISLGAFHAEQMGVMVICSGGNSGPDPYTIVNTAPWIFTVAASNIDRDFQSTVLLGNGKAFQGSAINFSNLTRSKTYPLARAEDVAAPFTPASDARTCYPGSLNPKKVAGKIIVCSGDGSNTRRIQKLVVEDAKAKGMILIDEFQKGSPFESGIYPFTEVGDIAGFHILKYINSTKNPTATILKTKEIPRFRPAPVVAFFSSRGPGGLTENILKPDIMAPGAAILAAMIPKTEAGSVPIGRKVSRFGIRSGTSMACPHVTGAAAFIKSIHRMWSFSMIRSALMTTAFITNNMRKDLTNSTGFSANPHEMGVGEISPLRALNPGLVFETTFEDYLHFLCYYGYPEKTIRAMTGRKFSCPSNSFDELISNMNYPSISISKLDRHLAAQTVTRTVRNVGSPNSTYTAKVHAPVGLGVTVSPKKMVFVEGLKRASFKVSFHGKEAPQGYSFGSITWFDGLHSVRMVFAVNVE